MAARGPSALLRRFRRTLPGALIWRALTYAPDFNGRARRRDLALVVAVALPCFVLLSPVAVLHGTRFATIDLLWLFALAALPIVAAMVRRVHDVNRYGSVLLYIFIPYVGWFWVVAYLAGSGARHDNIFGPDPRA